ncbi:MAG: hypothetical protein KC613_08870 [Myxococcales bacterium]|nr:hypothetical protein [Myxococcales bacterium]
MSTIRLDLVLLAIGALAVLALAARTLKLTARPTGPLLAAGLVSLVGTEFLTAADHQRSFLVIDAASLPRLAVWALLLWAITWVVPRRDDSPALMGRLLALVSVSLLVTFTDVGPAHAALFAASSAVTWWILPHGAPRRLAALPMASSALIALGSTLVPPERAPYLMYLAVAIRLGVFPFHTWAVGLFERAPLVLAVAITAPLAGIGALARTPLPDDAWFAFDVWMVLSAYLTGGLAIVQRRLDRALGFFIAASASVVLIGVSQAGDLAHLGGLMMWGVTSAALVGLGLVVAALSARWGVVDLTRHSGLLQHTPSFAILFLFFGLATVGAPGTADFASQDVMLHGPVSHHPALLLALVGAISLQGYAVLHLGFRVFFGPPRPAVLKDVLLREHIGLVTLALILVLTGLAPQALISGLTTAEAGPPAASPRQLSARVAPQQPSLPIP